MFREPNIQSSYRYFNLGKDIYDTVIALKPKKIIEFGCYKGYSAVCMAMALKDLNEGGKVYCYDLWEKFEYTHTSFDSTIKHISNLNIEGLSDYLVFEYKDLFEWIKEPEPFDLLHIDIGNTGDIIESTFNSVADQIKAGSSLIFEGGSAERDEVHWMKKYNKTPICSLKEKGIHYLTLNHYFPSLSIISDNKNYLPK
jgi:Methyltransferase domain